MMRPRAHGHVRGFAAALLRLVSTERGALLWGPSVLVAAYLVLFGIHQAPAELSLFNLTRDLRVAIGPLQAHGVDTAQADAFRRGLRRGLSRQRELSLVDSERMAARLEAVLGQPAPRDPQSWIRATRNLNVRFYLTGELQSRAGHVEARLEVWEVSRERAVCTIGARHAEPLQLGLALADSIGVTLFRPQLLSAAAR
ncbi:MAG: hypothetical protein ACE5G2_01355 [Candidatus Krumholzibacteriia bacterium]